MPRSKPRVVLATFQPLLSPPTTFSFGQRASAKKTSLNSAVPSGCDDAAAPRSPACFIGTSR